MDDLVNTLKDSNQDLEWYPTTDEILECIKGDMPKHFGGYQTGEVHGASVLDCGAGDGRALKYLSGCKDMYAIEKSKVLLNEMSPDIFIVGTDFEQSTLIDKKVDVVFCNPPYSQYEQWAAKIISEANSSMIYLVIPERWQNSTAIKHALDIRQAETTVLGSFDFLNAERQARAKVNIVAVQLYKNPRYNRDKEPTVDPFSVWFDSQFKFEADKATLSEKAEETVLKSKLQRELTTGRGVIPALVELYNHDMVTLQKNYAAVSELDPYILKELGVSVGGLMGSLKQKIKGLKNIYWQELFDNYQSITSRLTKSSRKAMLDKLCDNTSVDFTESNALAVTIWAIKNANKYFDDQLIQLVEGMVDSANIVLYKSNQRTFDKEEWRYCRKPNSLSRYALELRIVLSNKGRIEGTDYGYSFDYTNGLSNSGHDFLSDICTIANNLGYSCCDDSRQLEWTSGKRHDFRTDDKILMSVKAFKNGNMHVKFNQDFIKKLNVEFGRLKGWLKNKQEASEELNIPVEDITACFNANYQLEASNVPLLGPPSVKGQ